MVHWIIVWNIYIWYDEEEQEEHIIIISNEKDNQCYDNIILKKDNENKNNVNEKWKNMGKDIQYNNNIIIMNIKEMTIKKKEYTKIMEI